MYTDAVGRNLERNSHNCHKRGGQMRGSAASPRSADRILQTQRIASVGLSPVRRTEPGAGQRWAAPLKTMTLSRESSAPAAEFSDLALQLRDAAARGDLASLEVVLTHGKDPNDTADRRGETALHKVCGTQSRRPWERSRDSALVLVACCVLLLLRLACLIVSHSVRGPRPPHPMRACSGKSNRPVPSRPVRQAAAFGHVPALKYLLQEVCAVSCRLAPHFRSLPSPTTVIGCAGGEPEPAVPTSGEDSAAPGRPERALARGQGAAQRWCSRKVRAGRPSATSGSVVAAWSHEKTCCLPKQLG